jgi:hypothetical protein
VVKGGAAVRAIDRRTFLRLGAGAVAALGAGARLAAPAPEISEVRQSAMPSIARSTPVTLADLAKTLNGRLVLPGSARYATSRLVYDLRYQLDRPVAVAYCDSPVDVARCLEFATAHRIPPIPRAGGHSYGGYSTGAGLIIDVSAMNRTSFSPGSALVGAGISLADLYAACEKTAR